jgi:hypothetical protein
VQQNLTHSLLPSVTSYFVLVTICMSSSEPRVISWMNYMVNGYTWKIVTILIWSKHNRKYYNSKTKIMTSDTILCIKKMLIVAHGNQDGTLHKILVFWYSTLCCCIIGSHHFKVPQCLHLKESRNNLLWLLVPWKRRLRGHSKYWQTITQKQSIMSKEIWIIWNTTARTLNLVHT